MSKKKPTHKQSKPRKRYIVCKKCGAKLNPYKAMYSLCKNCFKEIRATSLNYFISKPIK